MIPQCPHTDGSGACKDCWNSLVETANQAIESYNRLRSPAVRLIAALDKPGFGSVSEQKELLRTLLAVGRFSVDFSSNPLYNRKRGLRRGQNRKPANEGV